MTFITLIESRQHSFLMEDRKLGAILCKSSLSVIKSENSYLKMLSECRILKLVLRGFFMQQSYQFGMPFKKQLTEEQCCGLLSSGRVTHQQKHVLEKPWEELGTAHDQQSVMWRKMTPHERNHILKLFPAVSESRLLLFFILPVLQFIA